MAQRSFAARAHRGGQPTATGDTTEYDYDALGNLKEVILPNGDVIEYRVDGANRRVAKLRNGLQERQWLTRAALQPLAEFDGAGNLRARFAYAGDRNVPSLIVTPSATYRVITDHLGSVRKVVNIADGTVAQELFYDAWGRVLLDTNPGFQPFGFAGGLYDADTELVRFGARDYDAATGRWTAKDPIRFAGGINLYEYVGADVVNSRDPSGRICVGGRCAADGFTDLLDWLLGPDDSEFDDLQQQRDENQRRLDEVTRQLCEEFGVCGDDSYSAPPGGYRDQGEVDYPDFSDCGKYAPWSNRRINCCKDTCKYYPESEEQCGPPSKYTEDCYDACSDL